MANENKAQQNIQETASSLKATSEAYRLQAGAQQEVNVAFKESINLLNKMNKLIDDSTSKIGAFEKSTINIKRIEQERERINRKSSNLQAELNQIAQTEVDIAKDYVKKLEKRRKEEDELAKRRSLGLSVNGQILAQIETEISRIERAITAEQLRATAIIQSKKGLEERVSIIGEELDKEKELAKSLGVTGKILQLSTKYLGTGKNLYGKIVEEARGGEFGTKKMAIAGAAVGAAFAAAYKAMSMLVNAVKDGLDSLTGTGGPIAKFFSPFTNLVKQIPLIGGFIGGLADVFFNLMDFATDTAAKVENFARNLGISYQEAKRINLEFASFAVNSGKAFLTVEKLQNSQIELSKALGVNAILNNQILSDNIQLQEQVGLELETRKELVEVALISGKYQTQIFKTIVGQVEALRKTVGINLRAQDIIANISKLSGVVGLTFAKYPEKLAKSLAITKALGTDFQKLDGIAGGILDFESSLSAEFEAQLMTGKQLNLQKARQLAMDNNLAGLALEINEQYNLKNAKEFLEMNRFEQESLAAVFKMSRDELADMLKKQEIYAAAGAKDLKTFRERVAEMERMGTLQSDFIDKLSEEQAQYYLSSTATEKIANFMEKIRQSFAQLLSSDQFKAFLDTVLNKLSDPNFLTNVINKLTSFVSLLLKAVAGILDTADVLGRVFTLGLVDPVDNSIIKNIRSVADSLDAQKLSPVANTVSVGSNVASSQAKSTPMTNATAATSKQQGGMPVVVNSPNIVIEDYTTSLTARINRSPERDFSTGVIAS